MARRKKNDFWDDVEEELGTSSTGNQSGKAKEEEWSAIKSTPIKLIMRFLLMIACLVALGSAYIAYQYVDDRYAGGSFSTDFYDSATFAGECTNSINQLLQLVEAIEENPEFTQSGNEEMLATQIENYMGKDTNFSFLIQDGDHIRIADSGDDAKDRIEASNHYALITNEGGEISVKSTISSTLLYDGIWEQILENSDNTYTIYCAVDNELTQNDSYYKAEQNFDQMAEYFYYAKFTGIISAIIFLICLIFCIMATGMKRGYDTVCLTWYDKIFTEIALIIMAAVGGAIVYGEYYLSKQSGDMYRYAMIAGGFILYFWVAQSYFSIVRRIKAGRLLRYSLIGCIIAAIGRGVGKLPKPLNFIVGALILIAINGAAVYGILFMKEPVYRNIPVSYLAAGAVFVIELLSLIVSRTGNDYDELPDEAAVEKEEQNDISKIADALEEEKKEEPAAEIKDAAADIPEVPSVPETTDIPEVPEEKAAPEPEAAEWETMDLSGAIAEAEKNHAEKTGAAVVEETVVIPEDHETSFLPEEEMEKALKAAGLTPAKDESAAIPSIVPAEEPKAAEPEVPAEPEKPNFVQLNKDVRKKFKASLKKQGISITVRAPEKPVTVGIDKESLVTVISDIFSQIGTFSKPDTRAYAEVYLHGGKVVYIVKISVAPEAMEKAQAAVAGGGYFNKARKIAEGNDSKFIVSLEGETLKIGMLMEAD